MKDEKIFRMLYIMFALRAKYYNDKWNREDDYTALGMDCAYSNAYEMLAYAMAGDWDAIRQFGWADEAEEILDRYDNSLDIETIKAIINQ